jgi:hypothetical protein
MYFRFFCFKNSLELIRVESPVAKEVELSDASEYSEFDGKLNCMICLKNNILFFHLASNVLNNINLKKTFFLENTFEQKKVMNKLLILHFHITTHNLHCFINSMIVFTKSFIDF